MFFKLFELPCWNEILNYIKSTSPLDSCLANIQGLASQREDIIKEYRLLFQKSMRMVMKKTTNPTSWEPFVAQYARSKPSLWPSSFGKSTAILASQHSFSCLLGHQFRWKLKPITRHISGQHWKRSSIGSLCGLLKPTMDIKSRKSEIVVSGESWEKQSTYKKPLW